MGYIAAVSKTDEAARRIPASDTRTAFGLSGLSSADRGPSGRRSPMWTLKNPERVEIRRSSLGVLPRFELAGDGPRAGIVAAGTGRRLGMVTVVPTEVATETLVHFAGATFVSALHSCLLSLAALPRRGAR